jgi:hypothetical protein
MCIGIRIEPARGIEWNAIGKITQSAISMAVTTIRFRFVISVM